ncbi:MAG: nicotinate phosphoribosyltransferase, partial [Halofilum sp. (in: g-proteobacteria)]
MSNADTRRAVTASALFTDLYELSMAQVYRAEGIDAQADFEMFFRELGDARGYVLAGGLETALAWLEDFGFSADELDYLRSLGSFSDDFIDWLAGLRFTGEVDAVPEGTAVFPNEPLLRVRAPIAVAQLLETRLLNAMHYESIATTKAARMVDAAGGAGVVDFGARRAHGVDAAVAAARSAWIAGCGGTSNMIAGQRFGLPVIGTMAHSYIETFSDEGEAFRVFAAHYPETTLLVDTYDTLAAVERITEMAQRLGDDFRISAIRIDSGDLADLSRKARRMLDAAGLEGVRIMASGGLDEHRIAALVASGAPIDGFGVGTDLVVSRDSPTLDFAYKLVAYDDQPRLKGSTGKATLPGRKQVFRRWQGATMAGDTITTEDEAMGGEPLLQPVMRGGQRLQPPESLDMLRARAQSQRGALPADLRTPDPPRSHYPVSVSDTLQALTERIAAEH